MNLTHIGNERAVFSGGELVIGLVGATGTNLDAVVEDLTEFFNLFGYQSRELRISQKVIPILTEIPEHDTASLFEHIDAHMTAGDIARNESGDNSIMALGVAQAIFGDRIENSPNHHECKITRCVYIVRSFKRPEEVQLLRQIYAEGFYLIGVYADAEQRLKYLIQDDRMSKHEAMKLIERDEDEYKYDGTTGGQSTRDTFHIADFFVHDANHDVRRNSLLRIVDILFGHPYHTPTFDEFAMYMAFASALRSGDLARQVGAVVAKNEEVLATGANDCPRYGGGLYWPEKNPASGFISDIPNGRDYKRGYDSNSIEKEKILEEIIKCIRPYLKSEPDNLEHVRKILNESRIRDITEYGRVVHAEMEALLSCARNNVDCRWGTLYCSTFPCHNCAKHLIAAGIKRVVYIEPYPKSKALPFHDDSITLGFQEDNENLNKVRFEPFVGVGPRNFLNLFSIGIGKGYEIPRKKDGQILKWDRKSARLRMEMNPYSYLDRETDAVKELDDCLKRKGALTKDAQ